jgi:hypothetical protein
LEASLAWHAFQRSMAEANAWIDDKLVIARSYEVVEDLDSCGRMLNEHRVINDQIAAQWEQKFEKEQLATAAKLIADGQAEAAAINLLTTDLTERYAELTEASHSQLVLLEDVRKTAKFLVDSADSLEWIRNQRASIASQDGGADESSTELAITVHAGVASNVEGHAMIVKQLAEEGRALIESRHAKCEVSTAILTRLQQRTRALLIRSLGCIM